MTKPLSIDDFPFVSDRLSFRLFRADDGPSLLALYGDPEVVRYLYSEQMVPSGVAESLARRMRPPRLAEDGDLLELAVEDRATGAFVGTAMVAYRSACDL